MTSIDDSYRTARGVTRASIAVSATLACSNIIIGLLAQSTSVVATGFEFAGDVLASSIVLIGMGASSMELPVATIQLRELVVTGTFRYANVYPAAIALAASGVIDLDGLVTAKFGLEQVAEALSASKTDPHTLKPMVYPGLARV